MREYGDYLVVGAWMALSGAAYVLTREAAIWTERAKLTPSGGSDNFGISVSLRAVAPNSDPNGPVGPPLPGASLQVWLRHPPRDSSNLPRQSR